MTQNEKVLRHLETCGSITPLDALKEYSIMRLASRVSDLKRMGYKITSEIITTKNKFEEPTHYSVYRLAEKDNV